MCLFLKMRTWNVFITFTVLAVIILTVTNKSICMSIDVTEKTPSLSLANDISPVLKRTKREILVYTPAHYEKCGKQYHCFPNSDYPCFLRKNCTYLVLWRYVSGTEYIEFQVMTQRLTDKKGDQLCSTLPFDSTRYNYIAIGFSEKNLKKNEKTTVVECSIANLGPKEYERQVAFAWSSKTEYIRWNSTCSKNTTVGKLIDCDVNIDRSSLLCKFQMKRRLVFNYDIFNFDDFFNFIHLTSGCNRSDITDKNFHNGGSLMSSETLVRFNRLAKTEFHSFRSNFAIWHGCLMLIVWCVLVPNGVFVSRYFKESFVEVSIFKYRLWFALTLEILELEQGHSIIMVVAFLVTLGALGTILQERAEVDFAWPTEKSTVQHFNLGFTALFLFIGQICIGWIRCHGRKLRRSFTTFHLFSGMTCYVISIVAIGLSYRLGMPCSISSYAISSGLWTLACHVAMTVHFYFVDKQLGLYIYRAFYPFPIPPVTYDELPGTKIRAAIFFVHLTGSILIASTMLLIYLSNETTCKL